MALLTFIFLTIAALALANSSKDNNDIRDDWISLRQQYPDYFLFQQQSKNLDSSPLQEDCISSEKCLSEKSDKVA